MTRLETFVDAAFAFVVTMLALSQDSVPTSPAELIELLKGAPAFVASLALLAMFWNGHVVFSRRYGLENAPTVILSIAFIGVMLIYMYPLKMMATLFFQAYVPPLRPSSGAVPLTSTDLSNAFIALSVGFMALHALLALMHAAALRADYALPLDARERWLTKVDIADALAYFMIGAASVALAVVFRNSGLVVLAGFVYLAVGGVVPLLWFFAESRGPAAAHGATPAQ